MVPTQSRNKAYCNILILAKCYCKEDTGKRTTKPVPLGERKRSRIKLQVEIRNCNAEIFITSNYNSGMVSEN